MNRFVALRTCGHAYSKRALKVRRKIKWFWGHFFKDKWFFVNFFSISFPLQTLNKVCSECDMAFTEKDVVILNPTETQQAEMRTRMEVCVIFLLCLDEVLYDNIPDELFFANDRKKERRNQQQQHPRKRVENVRKAAAVLVLVPEVVVVPQRRLHCRSL